VTSSRAGKSTTRRRRPGRWTAAVAFVAAVAGLGGVMGSAATTGDDPGVAVAPFTRIDANLLAAAKASGFVPAALSTKPVNVMLELSGDPVAVQQVKAAQQGKSLSKAQKDALRAQLKSSQDSLAGSIQSAGGTIVAQLQTVYNGVQVVIPQKDVPQLAGLPGVVAVHAVQTFKPSNTNGVPFIGGPTAWGTFSETGAGVKIAVIDTGIDYTHADFGGPGTDAAWTYAKAHSTDDPALNPTLAAEFGPAAAKVKGGTDFVGDSYNAISPNPADQVPHPDKNPLDCNGHGSHTAGTAAGFGVLSTGATYTGSYGATTISSNTWNVGPGVAPKADIYAYRVFGCQGDSNVVAAAIDRAVADNVDVISMSLGSPLGGQDDPTTVAAEHAAAVGVTVVAAAGNSGSSGYIVSSPSTGSHVLSVAAMDAGFVNFPGARLSTSPTVDTIDANGASLPGGSHPVKVLKNPDGSISLGCNPAEYAGSTGDIVVTMRGTCGRVDRAIYGEQAGAFAVVMVNNVPGLPPYEGPILSNPDTGVPFHVTIPFLGADPANAATLVGADGTSVTLTSISVVNANYQKVASFSSGGPRNPDSAPKPEVIAPGVSVASAAMGTGTGFVVESGTSMATPMTAGTAALVKQAHPSWSPAQIKAAIQNTADPSLNIGYNVRRAGAGVVQAQKAVDSTVLAQTADGLNSVAFGYVPGSGPYSASKTVTFTNTGASTATYDLAVAANGSQLGTSVTVSPPSLTLPAGGSADATVSLSVASAAFAAMPSDDTFALGPGGVLTVRGDVVATPTSGSDVQTLTVPYLVAPRGLSNIGVASLSGASPKLTAQLTNSGVHSGTAGIFAWGIHSGPGTGDTADVQDVGVQAMDGKVLGGKAGDTGLLLGISTNNPSANQTVNEYDVLIDTNGDGVPDFDVVGVDLGAVLTGSFNGVMASFIVDLNSGALVDAFFAEAPMNGSIVELPLLASDIGLTPGHSRFTYGPVFGFSLITGAIDTTGQAVFDVHSQPVSSGDAGSIAAGGSLNVPLTLNPGQLAQTPAKGWLVFTPDDTAGAQADEVPLP
jgi:minor extracellular serine protease Vpr